MTVLGQMLKVVILMASTVLLSRLLSPEDFGLVAMVAVVVALGELLRDLGLSTAALRAPTLSQQQASNLFWLNSGLGLLGGVLVAAAAPLFVLFYGEAELGFLAPVLACSLLINGIQAQYQVQLARAHKFVALNMTDVLSQLLALGAAVGAAVIGWGYWALVIQTISAAVVLLVSRLCVARWRPHWFARDGETMPLVRTGIDYSATQLLAFGASNIDTVMIGSVWGAASLGLYNRAFQLESLPVARLMSPLVTVVVPVMNVAKAAGESVYSHFLKVQSIVGMFSTFVFAIAIVMADPLIPLVLGEEWGATVWLFRVLAVGGAVQGLSQVSFWIFLVEGKSRELLKYNLVTKTLTIAMVIGGSIISLEGAAAALALSWLVSWPINILWLGRTAQLPVARFLSNGARILLTGILAVTTVMLLPIDALVDSGFFAMVLEGVATGGLCLLLVLVTRNGRQDLATARSAVKVLGRRAR